MSNPNESSVRGQSEPNRPVLPRLEQSGQWIKRQADKHVCRKPHYVEGAGIRPGDRWRCNECGAVYAVKGLDGGPQWDPYPLQIQWEQVQGAIAHSEKCQRCDGDNITWIAPSPLWNAVIRDGSIGGDDLYGIVCPLCFVQLAEERGIVTRGGWRLSPTHVEAPLETTTPDGRVWDDQQWMWVQP